MTRQSSRCAGGVDLLPHCFTLPNHQVLDFHNNLLSGSLAPTLSIHSMRLVDVRGNSGTDLKKQIEYNPNAVNFEPLGTGKLMPESSSGRQRLLCLIQNILA